MESEQLGMHFNENTITLEPEQLGMQLTNFTLPLNLNQNLNEDTTEKILKRLENIETKLDERKATEEKIIRSLARIEAKIDALALSHRETVVVTPKADILKPVATLDEAVDLEEALKEEIYFGNIVSFADRKINLVSPFIIEAKYLGT